MPLIHVYSPRGALDASQRSALAEHLTAVVIEIEGGVQADGPKARSIAWVMFHELEREAWFIGALADDTYVSPPGKFLVNIYVPEGTLSKERKAMVHSAVENAFFKVFGIEPATDRWPSIFAHIHEWAEGNIGIFGRSHGLADVGQYAVGDGNPEIRARSMKYMAARSAWRKNAGFPD